MLLEIPVYFFFNNLLIHLCFYMHMYVFHFSWGKTSVSRKAEPVTDEENGLGINLAFPIEASAENVS